jgi:hypothetical protein
MAAGAIIPALWRGMVSVFAIRRKVWSRATLGIIVPRLYLAWPMHARRLQWHPLRRSGKPRHTHGRTSLPADDLDPARSSR